MILTDSIELLTADLAPVAVLPAHVGYTRTGRTGLDGGGFIVEEELRCIIEPAEQLKSNSVIRWRGDYFTANSTPLVRRRGDADHHWTLVLERQVSA